MKGITVAFLIAIVVVVLGVIVAAMLLGGLQAKALPGLSLFSPESSEVMDPFYVPKMTIDKAEIGTGVVNLIITSYAGSSQSVYVNVSSVPRTFLTEASEKILVEPGTNIEISVDVPGISDGAYIKEIKLYTMNWMLITYTAVQTA